MKKGEVRALEQTMLENGAHDREIKFICSQQNRHSMCRAFDDPFLEKQSNKTISMSQGEKKSALIC